MAYKLNGSNSIQNLKKAIFKGLTIEFEDGYITIRFEPPNYIIEWELDGQRNIERGSFEYVLNVYSALTGESLVDII